MSRSVGKWIVFIEDGVLVAVILGGRPDAVFTVDFKGGDRDHQVGGKLEGMGLCERKIVRLRERLHPERANSRSMAPKRP